MSAENHLDRRSKYSIHVIREALFELLETKSLDEITVVDVCSKADVNRGTFYKYFRDVPDLYDKTENFLIDEIFSSTEKSNTSDFQNQFMFKEILDTLADNKEFTYISQNQIYSERLAQKLLTYFVPHLHHMLELKCPNASKQNSDLLLEYILGGCIRVVSYWMRGGLQISVDEINKELTTMITHTLSMYE